MYKRQVQGALIGVSFFGQWLIGQSDAMTSEYWDHHPYGSTDAQFAFGYYEIEPGYFLPAEVVTSEKGFADVTIRYWEADVVPNPEYYYLALSKRGRTRAHQGKE